MTTPEVPLETEFRHDRFRFSLVKREGDVAMFSKIHDGGRRESFEVVLVQHHASNRWPNGDISPAREAMPSPESWGTLGWSYPTRLLAERRFNQLVAESRKAAA